MPQAAKLRSGSSRDRKSSAAEKPEERSRQPLPTALCRHPSLESRFQRSLRITSVSTTSMPLLERGRTQPRLSLVSYPRIAEKQQSRVAAPVDSIHSRRHTHDSVTATESATEIHPVSAVPPPPPTPQSMAARPSLRPAEPNDRNKYRRSHQATISVMKSRRFTRLLRRRPRHASSSFEEELEAMAEAAFDASAATSSPFFSYFVPLPRYRERGQEILTLVKPPRDRFRERMRRQQQPTASELAYGQVDPGDFLHVI